MSNSTQSQTKADASEQPQQQQKPQVLEEDDEFEDFPVEGKLSLHHPEYSISITDMR